MTSQVKGAERASCAGSSATDPNRAAKRERFSLLIENNYASRELKRPRGPRPSLTRRRLEVDLQTKALAYYLQFHLHVLTVIPNDCYGLSECVTAWMSSGTGCAMVDLALSSMALAVYARTQQHPSAAVEASTQYQRLLQLTREEITRIGALKVEGSVVDTWLLAILLMSRYEGAVHSSSNTSGKPLTTSVQTCSHHHDGATAILRLWYEKPGDRPATLVVKQTRRNLIKGLLLRNLRSPEWMLDGSWFGEHGSELTYDRVISQIVELRFECATFQQKRHPPFAKAERCMMQARKLDILLQGWIAQVSEGVMYERHVLTLDDPWPRKHFFSQTFYEFFNPEHAALWSQYFATRILLDGLRLKIVQSICKSLATSSKYEQQRQACIDQMTVTAEHLASSIPYCLERVAVTRKPNSPGSEARITLNLNKTMRPYLANLVVWPLTVASSFRDLDIGLQMWFRSQLASLGRIAGEGILECAESDQWVVL
ncbi:MAG: hypothetical protein Q9220_005583 [cf. Caloplaca sp. 1 TL-2023]